MAVNFLELIASTGVDLKGLEQGLSQAEKMTEESGKKIASSMNLIGIGIATALSGAVVTALTKAIEKTAEWGLEMEHMGNRMGMTAREAAVLTGVMERFGVNANVGARAMQMLSSQIKQTQNSLDPFSTRLGRTLGTLRDTDGKLMNTGQVLDLIRQKVSGAATDTEKLSTATTLLGSRIGGQLVPMLKLNNEEWDRQKKAVEATLGPVEEAASAALAYKSATAELAQTFRGLQVQIGTALLPTLIDLVNWTSQFVQGWRKGDSILPSILKWVTGITAMQKGMELATREVLIMQEGLGLVAKGTVDIFDHMKELQEQARKAGLDKEKLVQDQENLNKEIEQTEQNERKEVAVAKEHVALMEKARALGTLGIGQAETQLELQKALAKFEEQRVMLEAQAQAEGVSPEQKERLEKDILRNRIDAAKMASDFVMNGYKEQEAQLRAMGAYSLGNEIELLEKKLADERIVGDERLKIEAEVYQKRRQYAEEAVKEARALGFMTVDQEVDYRKKKSAEMLQKGDIIGAAQELQKARDLAIKQADQVMEFTKKIRVVSLNDEIEYQRQKLQMVKGNAEEEMKILNQIADLDKQLYDKRLQYSLNYAQKAIDAYREIQKVTGQDTGAVSGPKEEITFARAREEAERARFQQARDLEYIAAHGGTEEQRTTAVKQAQDIMKQMEEMQQLGKSASDGMKEAAEAARDVLRAASGGEEVRAPGGPSPLVGSLLSPAEGLSTSTLARGTDIPRLDTSFSDIAIRLRDVLLGAIPNIQNFSNQLASATKQMTFLTNIPNNPGIVGPGGAFTQNPTQGSPPYPTSASSPAPTTGPSTVPSGPSAQIGISATTSSNQFLSKLDDVKAAIKDLSTNLSSPQSSANAESILGALNQILSQRQQQGIQVQVSMDPNTGELLTTYITNELSK